MFIRINTDRTVKGINPMIPAEVGPRSMGKEFFWNKNPIEESLFNMPWSSTTGQTDFPLIANHPKNIFIYEVNNTIAIRKVSLLRSFYLIQ